MLAKYMNRCVNVNACQSECQLLQAAAPGPHHVAAAGHVSGSKVICLFLFFLNLFFIEIWLNCNVVLLLYSIVIQSYIYIHSFPCSFAL